MTTIATDGKSMAGDTLTSAGGCVTRFAPKVFRTADGRIFGCCGDSTESIKFGTWMIQGGDQPSLGDNFEALVLNSDGTVDWWDNKFTPVRSMAPAAVGSGYQFATGAMLAGKSPKEAVEIAAIRDLYTGGEITVEHLDKLSQVA